jgi:hypothetical protein
MARRQARRTWSEGCYLFGRPLGPRDAAVGTPSTPGGGGGRESGGGGHASHSQMFVSALKKTCEPLRRRADEHWGTHAYAYYHQAHTKTHAHARFGVQVIVLRLWGEQSSSSSSGMESCRRECPSVGRIEAQTAQYGPTACVVYWYSI